MGATPIHGELLMLGFEVAKSTVSKYMVRGRSPPSQSWKTLLQNHAEAIAAIDISAPRVLDRMLILGESHLRQILTSYATCYKGSRTHLSLHKDTPLGRAAQRYGNVTATSVLSGLHHRYTRM
jgi:hypothetical protein